MSMPGKKTWKEKLNINRTTAVDVVTKPYGGVAMGEKLLIPTPKLFDDYIREIPKGSQVSIQNLKEDLALTYNADKVCPLCTGIFLRIVAEAAYEDYCKGTSLNKITPFWRVIDEHSKTAKKLTFGTAFLKEQRKKERLSEQ